MATVLGKSPPPFNANDVAGSVKSISNYLIYLHENIDYQLGQLKKADTETATTLEGVNSSLEAIGNTLREMNGGIAELQNKYLALEQRVAALEQA